MPHIYLSRVIVLLLYNHSFWRKNAGLVFGWGSFATIIIIFIKELDRLGKLVVDGTLYKFLTVEYKKQTGYNRTRMQMKKALYKIFFSKVKSFGHLKAFFGGYFPKLMSIYQRHQ